MKFIAKVVDFAPLEGQFLKSFDFEADNGRGFGEFTLDPKEAMSFDTPAALLQYLWTTPKTRPTRWDGAPNRPLTATTFEIVKVPGLKHHPLDAISKGVTKPATDKGVLKWL